MSSTIEKSATALLFDVRFWICAFFLLHLAFITLPPLEPISTWRQTDGLMIARNFHETDGNILYPRVDVAGEKSGIVGCEFPLLNYSIAAVANIFGYQHWYGRLINLIISSLGVYFYHKIILRWCKDVNIALFSSIIMMASVWFTYCRTNIPDTFGLSLCIIALYFGIAYLENGKPASLLLFFLLALAGTLAKISTACILSLMSIPFFFGVSTHLRRIAVAVLSIVLLSIAWYWYFVWVPYLNDTFGFHGHFFMGLSFQEGFNDLIANTPLTLKRFYSTAMKYTGFAVFLVGVFMIIKKRDKLAMAAFFISFFAALFVIIKTGYGLHVNAYYMIIFIPSMAFAAAYGLSQIKNKRIAIALLLLICCEGILNQIHILKIREPNLSLVNLERILDQFTDRSDLIVINGSAEADPTPMYFAHRKGWVLPGALLATPEKIDDMRSKGCRIAVVLKKMGGDIELNFPVVFDSDTFKIYDLK